MKKRILMLLVVSLLVVASLGLVACGGDNGEAASYKDQLIDKTGKTVTIGYTNNAPMGIKDGTNVSGFDIELAKAIFEAEGITVKTQEIKWANKEIDLATGTVDLVWNGLTRNPQREEAMQLSKSYLVNQQAIVVRKENADKYSDLASLNGKKIAVENGSAGQDTVTDMKSKPECKDIDIIKPAAQIDALKEVMFKTSDVAIIDSTMAGYLINKPGSEFGELKIVNITGYEFTQEYYAVAAKKGNDMLIDFVNAGIKKCQENGKYDEIAAKYGLTSRKVVVE